MKLPIAVAICCGMMQVISPKIVNVTMLLIDANGNISTEGSQ